MTSILSPGVRTASARAPWRMVPLTALFALGAAGCLSDLSIPDDTVIACEKGDACPGGLVCAESIGRCVDPALVNLEGIVVTADEAPTPGVLSDVAPFDETVVSFVASRKPDSFEARTDEGSVVFPCDDGVALDGDDADGVRFTCTVRAPEDRRDGELTVFGFAKDELGAETNAWVRLAIDRTPPSALSEFIGAEHLPADDNPRSGTFASASTYGGTVRVSLVFDEPVTIADVQIGAFAAVDVPLEPALTFTVSTTLPRAGDPAAIALVDGALDVTLIATDRVGNTSELVLEELVLVDVTAPAPLAADTDSFLLRRTPWGAAEDGPSGRGVSAPHTEVRVLTAAVPDDVAAVRVSKDGVPAATRAVDRMESSFFIPLLGDPRSVDVEAVDDAGNASAATRVAHVEWVASLVGKVVGSTFENPHTAYDVGDLGGSVTGASRVELDAPGALVLADDDAHATQVRRTWSRPDTDAPIGRGGAVFAFDAARGRVVCANGLLEFGPGSTTMELVGDRWVERAVDSPPPFFEMASTYDRVRGRVLAFGGDAFGNVLGDELWEFDGVQWATRDAAGPPARYAAAMAFDAARGVAVLFGGRDDDSILGDTWEWDGLGWTETTPLTGGPSARRSSAMAWDEDAQRIVMHGGAPDFFADVLLDDTWAYADGAWSPVGVPTGRGRDAPAMTFDPVRGRLVMFGGTLNDPAGPPPPFDFVELQDDDTWAPIPDPGAFARPPDRFLAHMATDLARGRVILYGGRPENYFSIPGSYAVLEDTWIWDGSSWSELRATEQHPLAPAGITFDPSTSSLLLYGGALYGGGVAISNVTHTFDGRVWLDAQSISSDFDPAATNVAMAPFDGGTALVEPNGDDTYQWYGYSWYTFAAAPNLAGTLAMAQAPPSMGGGQSALLVGGVAGDPETWLLSDANYAWSRVCDGGAGQSCPLGDALAYDSARERVVAVDASGTWEHDGVSWTLRVDVATPPLSQNAQATFDTDNNRVLLFTGDSGAAQIFEYDGASWFTIDSTNAPTQPLASFAFDPISSRPILTGGRVAGYSVADTWALSPIGRPAQLLQFAFGAADFAGVELLEAALDVVAGGSAPSGDGVQVLLWSDARFVPLADSDGGAQSRANVRASASGATLAHALLGPERAMVFAVTPRHAGANAQSRSTVALDEVVLTVRYRLVE